ncbi:splicing factor 3B subunit 4-like, partial [Olea europaea subsp. europaea]
MTMQIAPSVGANLLGQHSTERNQDTTVYVGNLDTKATLAVAWAPKVIVPPKKHGSSQVKSVESD